jgi:hypothetical protein
MERVAVGASYYWYISGDLFLRNDNSDKCMGINGGSQANGVVAIQWTCHWTPWSDQQFEVYQVAGIWHQINPKHSAGKCLGVSAARTAPGTSLIQWTCDQDAHEQQFAFRSNSASYSEIIVRHTGQCVGVSNGSLANGGRVIQWPCTGHDDQRWWSDR